MGNEVTVEIKLDADLKEEAEKLYDSFGLTLEEAIPLLVKYNVEQDISPFKSKPKPTANKISAFGSLSEYANPALIPFEDGALERAMVKKYAASLN